MFKSFMELMKLVFTGRVRDTFEEMVLQDTIEKNKPQIEEAKPTTLVLDTPVEPIKPAAVPAPVNDQITDSVTQTQITDSVTKAKPVRARGPKGRLKADDKQTPETNEAWVGGKSPAKKTPRKKSRSKRNK